MRYAGKGFFVRELLKPFFFDGHKSRSVEPLAHDEFIYFVGDFLLGLVVDFSKIFIDRFWSRAGAFSVIDQGTHPHNIARHVHGVFVLLFAEACERRIIQ